jgi:hypothetical protein
MTTVDKDEEIVAFVAAHPALLDLIQSIVDDEDCWFDHHGGCQGHLFLSLQPGQMCPNEEAKRLVKEAILKLGDEEVWNSELTIKTNNER